jgi:GAF domain-containing protein
MSTLAFVAAGSTTVAAVAAGWWQARRARHAMHLLEETQSLLDLHIRAADTPDEDLYDFALARGVALTQSDVGFFHLVGDDQREIVLTTWNAKALTNCRIPEQRHYPIDEAGIWVDCVRTRAATVVNDYAASARPGGLPAGHFPLHRFMSVPVLDGDHVRIIFGVGNKRRPYDAEDVRRLNLVAAQLHRLVVRRRTERELLEAQQHVRTLHGLIPMCAWCKKVRDDDGFWGSVEQYILSHSDALVTHGICPECRERALAQPSR